MNKHTFFFLAILFSLDSYGQSIRGKVLERSGDAMPFVNVLLLNANDSSLVKGAVTDTLGVYVIDNVALGTYLVSTSMIGYEQAYLPPIKITAQNPDLKGVSFNLAQDSKQLQEVVITEKRPFVEQYIDKMVVNVANSIIASGSTALEVLEKAPGVTVDRQNNSLQLRGKGGVIVQMDGKQTYLSMEDLVTLLSSMSSDNIDQIELITNPSAKYDAAGNSGIINIRLKKNNSIGTNGSLSLGLGTGRFDRERGSLQINHRTKKLNFFGNYSANRGGNYFDLQSNQSIDNGEQQTFTDQDTYIPNTHWGQNAKAGLDYFIGKNTTIGIVWTGFWNDNGEDGTARSAFNKGDGVEYLVAETLKTSSTQSTNQVGNLNFQHSFADGGGQLSADFDIGQFSRDFANTLRIETTSLEDPIQPVMGLLSEMPSSVRITTAKLDYNRTVFSNWKMEAGVKSAYVKTDNDLSLSRGEIDDLIRDDELSNHFAYTEKVYATYASFSGKLGNKTEMQLGLRAEHTHSEGNSITENSIVKRDYLNFFPSFFLSQHLSKDHTLTFSYSYRIDRPNYQELNPARWYVDPYLYSRGNPYLLPQYTHSLELKHGFKDKLFTSLGASFVSDLVFYLIQPVDTIRTERTPLNVGTSQAYNLTVSFPVKVMKGWNLQMNFMGLYSRFDYNYKDNPIVVEQISGRFNGSNTFVFPHGWTGELTGWLSTPSVQGLARAPWRGSVDAGLQKALGSKFKAKLSLQDVFHTNWYKGKINVPGFTSDYVLRFDTRVVMLNLTYTFGNQKLKAARQRRLGSEEESQRTN